jgi:hypothetical protein
MENHIRSYNSFLRSAKSQQGLSHKQAQALYRSLGTRLGSAPNRLDLKKHPSIVKQEVRPLKRRVPSRTTVSGPSQGSGGGGGSVGGGGGASRSSRDFFEFMDSIDDFDYPYDEYDSSAEYEET